MLRFLHTADWQIGRQYGRFASEDAALLASARLSTIKRLATLATEHQVDAVLVAGDIFDAPTISERTLRQLFLALEGYAGPWLLLPGNHDAALPEGVWAMARKLKAVPANVHILDTPGVTHLPESNFAVLAAPLTQRQTYADLTAPFSQWETAPGLLRIGLAHGSVQGILADTLDNPNPIAADRALEARLDYLALGDWHGTRQINERTWYAGTPEPDRFRNNEAGHALLIDIEAPGALPQVQVLPTAQHHWFQLQATLHLSSDITHLLERLGSLPPDSVVDLELDGELSLSDQQSLLEELNRIAAHHRSMQWHTEQLRLQPTDEDLTRLQADGYLADVLDELRAAQEGPDGTTARAALALLASLLQQRLEDQQA